MGSIFITKITSKEELAGHSCGVDCVDGMIASSFFPNIYRQQDTYKIVYKNRIVGFYAIKIKAINCWDSEAEFAEYFDGEPSFGVVYVKYLGIDAEFQGCGLGKCALGYIVSTAYEEAKTLPIRLIVFNALRDKVPYYKNRGFMVLKEKEYQGNSDTVEMFFDLMPDEEFERVKSLSLE